MKTAIGIVLMSLAFLSPRVESQQTPSTADAESATRRWLALTDAGEFDRSWDQAAGMFQTQVTKSAWACAAASARSPPGGVIARKVQSARYAKALPGAPDGEYLVIQFETKFENKAIASEVVTPARGKDGSWRVSGYFIR